LPGRLERLGGARARLTLAFGRGRENDAEHRRAGPLGEQAQEGAPAADLDVVAVRADAEHPQRRPCTVSERDRKHQSTVASGMGTMNFAPQARACESCAMISSFKFQGKMKM